MINKIETYPLLEEIEKEDQYILSVSEGGYIPVFRPSEQKYYRYKLSEDTKDVLWYLLSGKLKINNHGKRWF